MSSLFRFVNEFRLRECRGPAGWPGGVPRAESLPFLVRKVRNAMFCGASGRVGWSVAFRAPGLGNELDIVADPRGRVGVLERGLELGDPPPPPLGMYCWVGVTSPSD